MPGDTRCLFFSDLPRYLLDALYDYGGLRALLVGGAESF